MATPPDIALAPPPPVSGLAPPHNLEAEQSVLGAILLSERSLYALVIEEGLRPEDFYRERHRITYAAMLALYGTNEPIDPLTVTEALRQSGQLDAAGGAGAIDELTGSVPLVGNARRYAQIVKENALLRRLLTTTYQIQASVAEHRLAPRDLVEQAEKAMLEVAHDDKQQDFRRIEEILHDELDKMQRLSAEGTALTGTPSGFKDLDEITGGFQPGNLIIIAARPSMGKCLRGSTVVYDSYTGRRRRIDDVVRAVENGDEVFVASLGPDLRLRTTRVSEAFRNGVKPIYRVRTKLGRRVDATANHPLLTVAGWRRLDKLTPGDRIAVPRRLPRIVEDSVMPDAEIVLLAALISDGSVGQSTPVFHFGVGAPMLDVVREAASDFGVAVNVSRRGTSATLSNGRGSRGNPVKELCVRHDLWGKRAQEKSVPDAIFRLDDAGIARFLGVLFACDGHVHATERLRQIGYATISEKLAHDVQHLLLRLGIVGKIRTLRRAVYDGTDKVAREVLITGQEDVARFAEAVSVVGKLPALARAVTGLQEVRSKTNVDTLPVEGWNLVLAAKGDRPWGDVSEAAGYPRNHNWHVGQRGLSRPRSAQLAEVLDSDDLRDLATSDVWWDEVASIEYVGEEETYDLTVPGDHNFVADDVIVHNSALVTNIAENASIDHNRPVALFSLEMSETELAQRFVASQGRIFGDKLRKGRVADSEWPKILEATKKLSSAPLYVDDSSDIGILDIRAKARRLHQQAPGGLGLVIIDYLQLMRPDAGTESRVEQVGQMSRGLKILARELNVPVIALSQLSRAVEQRHDKKPILSDLRECVTGDTLVVLADGRRVPIRDLVGMTPEVVAVDEDDRVVSATSDRVWRVGKRPVLTLRLASGRTLRATADHRVRAFDGWRRIGELGAGDRVALSRRLPTPKRPLIWSDDHEMLATSTNVDTVPKESWSTVRDAMAESGVSHRAMATLPGTSYGGGAHVALAPSRDTLTTDARLLDDRSLARAATSDLFWDRVTSVTQDGEEDVYDLTVPGPACWLADGIVTHNSGQIEQDADLVMFIYRDEYYEKDESESQGLADILIAKHRNGGLGDVTLTFRKEYPKFLNYAGDKYG